MNQSLREVIQLLRKGLLTPKEICDRCIARAERVRELNAFITETHDEARREAELATERQKNGTPLGPLDGIPIAVKDNFSTRDVRTSCGSRMLQEYVPPYTATVVHRLLRDGALLMGKTNMDEFAMGTGSTDSSFGPVRNPWKYPFSKSRDQNLEDSDWFITGGSSGGSAVAVATGICFAALGSDTGGSVRAPSGHVGVVGLKPTYGLLSRHGLIPLVNSLDVPGIFTRYVRDMEIVLNSIAGHCPHDSTTSRRPHTPIHVPDHVSLTNVHVGVPREFHGPMLDSDTRTWWGRVLDGMQGAGAHVRGVSLPHMPYSVPVYSVLCAAEVSSNMARYDGIQYGHRAGDSWSTEDLFAATRHEGFNDVVRGRVLAGNFFLLKENYEKFFLKALRVRRLICEDYESVFRDVSILVTPVNISDATRYSEFIQEDNRTRTAQYDIYTQSVNLAGLPAVTVPCGVSSNGLPIGLQLIAPRFQEQHLLSVAQWVEEFAQFPRLDLDQVLDMGPETRQQAAS